MNKTIKKDGVTYYGHEKLSRPEKDDFFHATGEIKFGGMYQPTGYFSISEYEAALDEHHKNMQKNCPNREGYYCKEMKCLYPKCLV
jgi:hypothetical protein